MTELKEVKTIYESNARQIPEMLRALATEIETANANKTHNIDQAVCVIRDSKTGRLNSYGWGDLMIDNSVSILSQAQNQLSEIAYKGRLWDVPIGGIKP